MLAYSPAAFFSSWMSPNIRPESYPLPSPFFLLSTACPHLQSDDVTRVLKDGEIFS